MTKGYDGDPRPYLVQAHRPGQFTVWFTDSKHDALEAAIAAAKVLEAPPWSRRVRVMDQNEAVHYKSATPSRQGFQKGHGAFVRKPKRPSPGGYKPRR